MATYCIGDIHGRFDLFKTLLKKINFDATNDRLYFLGDVIDHHYGGVKVLKYILDNKSACVLIKGNHEKCFLDKKEAYKMIMLNSELKIAFKNVVDSYTPPFMSITDTFLSKIKYKDINAMYESAKIKKWLKAGRPSERKNALDKMFLLAKTVDFDKKKFGILFSIIEDFETYKSKNFVKELLEQNADTYLKILQLCEEAKDRIELKVQNNTFVLAHDAEGATGVNRFNVLFPHANTNDKYFIFGHLPVPILHRTLKELFNFNYREAFSIVDKNNNFYYNLDLGSSKTNPQVILRLDDLNEFYASENSEEILIDKTVYDPNRHFCVEEEIANDSLHTYLTTFKGNSYEYLIGAHLKEQLIVYFRVDMLDLKIFPFRMKNFYIEKWYDGQSVEEIIKKVDDDFMVKIEQPDDAKTYSYLYEAEH